MLGVELLRTRDVRSTHKLVIEHIAKIRASCPALAHCMAVMCLESNLAYEAQHILHAMNEAKVPNWVALSEGQAGTLGWLTTNERKESMMFQLRDALRVGSFLLWEHFFSTTMSETDALAKIRDELCRFAIVTEPSKTLFGKVCHRRLPHTVAFSHTPPLRNQVRKTYTGKLGGMQVCIVPTLAPSHLPFLTISLRLRMTWRSRCSSPSRACANSTPRPSMPTSAASASPRRPPPNPPPPRLPRA